MVLLHPRHVPVAEAVADLEDGEHAVNDGGDGAHGDEGVHIGRALEEGLEAHLIVFVVEVHDGQGQQELDKGEGQGVFHPCQKARQGRAHHMAHGDVKEGDKEGKGPDKAVLHLLELPGHHVLPLGLACLGPRLPRQGGPVAGGHHRSHNLLRRDGGLVVCHLHIVGEEVDIDGGHPLHPAHGLLHVGRAGRAGHTGYAEGLLHGIHLTF